MAPPESSSVVATRTIGRRTERRLEGAAGAGDVDENNPVDVHSSSSDEDDEEQGAEGSAGDPHLMTKKELQRTFKEHTENAQARWPSYRRT